MAELPLTGGCLCGGVRYEIDAPLVWAGYCHCTRCQRRTGTGSSANATVADGSLRIVAGAELVREWRHPDGGAVKCFCGTCGGALWSRHPETGETSVRLGTIDGDPGIRPSYHQFVDYAATWEAVADDDVVRFPERRRSS
ncbi:MAG TPA: GFA family protein [Gaiellaceae bacterium]|nr:GFA family protein [Gaiellaceae bacterium]